MVPEEGVVFCFVLSVRVQHLFEERVMVGDWGQSCYYHQSLTLHTGQVLGKLWEALTRVPGRKN